MMRSGQGRPGAGVAVKRYDAKSVRLGSGDDDGWPQMVERTGGEYVQAAAYDALAARLAEVERERDECIRIAGEALGTDPDLRNVGCVEVLAGWCESLVRERDEAIADRDYNLRLVSRLLDLALFFAGPGRPGLGFSKWEREVRAALADTHNDRSGKTETR